MSKMKFEKIAKNVTLFKVRASFGLTLFHYLIEHPKGNFLVSCPGQLNDEITNKIEEIGGIDYIFIITKYLWVLGETPPGRVTRNLKNL